MSRPLDEVHALMERGYDGAATEEEFERVALKAHGWQAERNPVVDALCDGTVRTWREIPLVPTGLFAERAVACFNAATALHVFRSSGTTGERSRHFFDDLALYRASALAGARWALAAAAARSGSGAAAFRVESLVPDDPESSLACMIRWMREEWPGTSDAGNAAGAAGTGNGAKANEAVVLIGTAFSYVARIDSGAARPLPPGSLVIETGGYKGRTRELTRDELHAGIAAIFAVPRERIIGEYGMCEIATPLWERPGLRGYSIPPWARVRILDPETLRDLPEGETGVIGILDLANLDSSIGILTADAGRLESGRLFVEGRLSGAVAKGCSLNA
jgi:hypothetical protein